MKKSFIVAAVMSLALFAGLFASCSQTTDDSALVAAYVEAAKREQETKDWIALTNIGTSLRLVDNTFREGYIRETKREWTDAKKENIKFTFKAVPESGYKFVYQESGEERRIKVFRVVGSEKNEVTDVTYDGYSSFSFVVPKGTSMVRVEGHDVFVSLN